MGITILRPGQRLLVPGVRVIQPSMAVSSFDVLSLSGLLVWFDAQDTATVYQDSGLSTPATANGTDPVGGWKDKSGSNRHATQATSGKRPVFYANVIGSRNAIRGDGVDDFLATASVAHGIGTGDFYIATVLRRHTSEAGYRNAISLSAGVASVYTRNNTGDKLTTYMLSKREFNSSLALNTNYVVELWRQSGTLAAAVNGTQEATTFSDSTSVGTAIIGLFASASNAEFTATYIAEVIITKTMPTSRVAVANYLISGYGIS